MKKIIIYTSGGLSNRVFSIASGIEFSRITNRELFIYWPIDRAMPANFSDLYKDKLNFIGEDFLNSLNDSVTEYHSKFLDTVENDYNFFGRTFLRNKYQQGRIIIGDIVNESNVENICLASNTFMEIIPIEISKHNLRKLNIVDDCAYIIEEFIKNNKLDKKVIGVHARGTDFDHNVNEYINKMKSSIEFPEQRFLICSDDEFLEKALINVFPNAIYRKNKNFVNKQFDSNNKISRGDINTIKDGIIDLYLLSKTNFKVYNQRSTFSSYIKILSGE